MENSIIADLKDSYGLTCNQIAPVTGGWLNQKWKVSTDTCELLVKQFSNKRYSSDKLKLVESALQRHSWQCLRVHAQSVFKTAVAFGGRVSHQQQSSNRFVMGELSCPSASVFFKRLQ